MADQVKSQYANPKSQTMSKHQCSKSQTDRRAVVCHLVLEFWNFRVFLGCDGSNRGYSSIIIMNIVGRQSRRGAALAFTLRAQLRPLTYSAARRRRHRQWAAHVVICNGTVRRRAASPPSECSRAEKKMGKTGSTAGRSALAGIETFTS